jgi:hypothetical protein
MTAVPDGPILTLAAVAALATTACLTAPDNDILQFEEDFEACDLCGWTLVGDARRVTTYHPGEHALALGVGATAGTGFAIVRNADDDNNWSTSDDGNWVELSTDCIGPGELGVRPLGDGRYAIELTLDKDGLGDFERHWLNFPPLPTDQELTFTSLTLATSGVPCTVDNLQIRISGGLYAW